MFISPMLLHETTTSIDDPNYLTELKLDGIRLIYSNLVDLKLYSRRNNEVTTQFPEILNELIPKGTILDGELIKANELGRPDFEGLMSRFLMRDQRKIKRLAYSEPVTYCAFDVIYYQGKDVCSLSLLERKEILTSVLPKNENIVEVKFTEGNGTAYFDLVKREGLEGCVYKLKTSKYEKEVRSYSWLKHINYLFAEVWLIGCQKSGVGWKMAFEDGRPAGIIDQGVPRAAIKAVRVISPKLKGNEDDDFVYFKQAIKCRIKYRCLTKSGLLRHPSFVRFVNN